MGTFWIRYASSVKRTGAPFDGSLNAQRKHVWPDNNHSIVLQLKRGKGDARAQNHVVHLPLCGLCLLLAWGTQEGEIGMPKTRYQHLQDAGDLCDSLVKQLAKAGEEDFSREAQQFLNRLWEAQQQSWDAVRDGVDEYEENVA